MRIYLMNIFQINVKKFEIYKQIREMNSATDYEYLQDELIDRFGEYPDVVAYLLEIGLVKLTWIKSLSAC